METWTLRLTFNECLVLDDQLSWLQRGPGGECPYPALLRKIGSAFLEVKPGGADVPVAVTEAELWMLREVAKAPLKVGIEMVGLTLKGKVHAGLQALAAEATADRELEIPTGTVQEPPASEYRQRLDDFQKGGPDV